MIRDLAFKSWFLVASFAITACTPYIYTAEAVLLSGNSGLVAIDQQKLRNCVFGTQTIPIRYTISTQAYSLLIISQQGFDSHEPQILVSGTTGKDRIVATIEEDVPLMNPDYGLFTFLMPRRLDGAFLTLDVRNTTGTLLGKEKLLVSFVTCRAMEMDAM